MSGSQVIVLCPNGRRATVKTTPGMSILQIIESACQKQKLNPDLYNLKLLRRVLDPSSTVRFSNVPNNAQLELVKAASPREAGLVTISLATESGDRLVADFPSTSMLYDILKYHEHNNSLVIPSLDSEHMPVIVYTMQRFSGDKLSSTSLKSLGIIKGSIALRYLIQATSTEGTPQPHVSGSLLRPKLQVPVEEPSNSQMECALPDSSTNSPPALVEESSNRSQPPPFHTEGLNPDIVRSAQANEVPDVLCADNICTPPDVLKQSPECIQSAIGASNTDFDLVSSHAAVATDLPMEEEITSDCVPCADQSHNVLLPPDIAVGQPMDTEEASVEGASSSIIPLGSHNAILFSLNDVPTTSPFPEEEPEGFFDLSVDEIRKLHFEQIKILREMEDAPLRTEQLRRMESESKLLSAMNQYPITQLRIIFPDQLVLQAAFKPFNKISEVKEFIKPFLNEPNMQFNLYTMFPKRILDQNLSLVESDCIPNARLYFEAANGGDNSILSDDTISRKSSFSGAQQSLKKNRSSTQPKAGSSQQVMSSVKKNESSKISNNLSEGSTGAIRKIPPSNQKTPKWFKLGK